jgi:hypothetical protein
MIAHPLDLASLFMFASWLYHLSVGVNTWITLALLGLIRVSFGFLFTFWAESGVP